MTGGSAQLRLYRIARRDGSSTEEAAERAGITVGEARLHDAEDARNPPGPECYIPLGQIGHNSGVKTMAEGIVAADQLRLYIERIERLEEEKKGIADDIRDVYSEAKSQGYDARIMRAIVRERKMTADDRAERDAILETYKIALGMLVGTPLGDYAVRTGAAQ